MSKAVSDLHVTAITISLSLSGAKIFFSRSGETSLQHLPNPFKHQLIISEICDTSFCTNIKISPGQGFEPWTLKLKA